MNDNEKKLQGIFSKGLNIPLETVVDSLEYNTISQWDSIAHMSLVGDIEDGFDIMMDTKDIIDMSTFKKAKDILEKLGVSFRD